jgi:hypothetical protein
MCHSEELERRGTLHIPKGGDRGRNRELCSDRSLEVSRHPAFKDEVVGGSIFLLIEVAHEVLDNAFVVQIRLGVNPLLQ